MAAAAILFVATLKIFVLMVNDVVTKIVMKARRQTRYLLLPVNAIVDSGKFLIQIVYLFDLIVQQKLSSSLDSRSTFRNGRVGVAIIRQSEYGVASSNAVLENIRTILY